LIRFVLDASVALAWFVDNPVAPYAARIKKALARHARAVVPGLWHLEMANGFAVAERRGILTAANATLGLVAIEQLLAQAIESSSDFISIRQALTTARKFQLSAYDAVYLDTARREHLPLATLDRKLVAAARQAGVELFS
jgi:predicted nucleic acid-binding protein